MSERWPPKNCVGCGHAYAEHWSWGIPYCKRCEACKNFDPGPRPVNWVCNSCQDEDHSGHMLASGHCFRGGNGPVGMCNCTERVYYRYVKAYFRASKPVMQENERE